MHDEAKAFVRQFATDRQIDVVEVGSRNINGSVRELFPNARWVGLDLHPGPDVDVVCDMLKYTPACSVDIVICCEVLEHAEDWGNMVRVASTWLKPGGRLIITCAGPGRGPHSHIDGGEVRPGEYYGNLSAVELFGVLSQCDLDVVICTQFAEDTQSLSLKVQR